MRQVIFGSVAQKDYDQWAYNNVKIFNKINDLIDDIDRNPYVGLGKPEPLKHELAGFWSRRINRKDRLIYQISPQNEIIITSCKNHYKYGNGFSDTYYHHILTKSFSGFAQGICCFRCGFTLHKS